MKIKMTKILVIFALFFAVLLLGSITYVAVIQPNFPGAPKLNGLDISGLYNPQTGATPAPATNVAPGQPQPLQFYLSDEYNSAITGANLTVYSSANQKTDDLYTSAGSATSGSSWTPGQTGHVVIYKSGVVYKDEVFVVPQTATIGQYGTPSYYIAISTKTSPTITIKAEDNAGNAYTTGDTLNFTTLGVTTVNLQFTIRNTEANTGYVTSYDKINNVNMAAGFTMYTTGSSVSVPNGITGTGISDVQTFPRGTNTYWSGQLNDEKLSNKWVGQTQVLDGVSTFTITVNKAALTAGNTQAFSIAVVAPFDATYYRNNASGGPNAADLQTFTLTFAA